MLLLCILVGLLTHHQVNGQFGDFAQTYGYVNIREGAHMFYWLFYTTADVASYTERPLIVWLQGGPGGSSTGIGNFEILGPLDLSLQEREHSWVKNFNVMFLDNPVGTGFSYVEDASYLTTTNEQIADDFVSLMRGFYQNNTEFEGVPLYIVGQSYGGKMAVDMGIKMKEAEEENSINSNLRGIAMGNSWIHPVDLTLTWGPLLLAAGLVDQAGHDEIQMYAEQAEQLYNEGQYEQSTTAWGNTQWAVFRATGSVDFYNILTKMWYFSPDTRMTPFELARHLAINEGVYRPAESDERRRTAATRNDEWDLTVLMNGPVKEALGIPDFVVWGEISNLVFNTLREDFMKPVTEGIEKLLNETDIIVAKYNGNLDLICDTPGQLLWVDRLQWAGAEGYRNAPRNPIWEDGRLEGYYKSYGNFRFFWINVAGHSAPLHNPAGLSAFLRDMTSFG